MSSSDHIIHAKATGNIEEYLLESQVHLSAPGMADVTRISEEIELGVRKTGETKATAWS